MAFARKLLKNDIIELPDKTLYRIKSLKDFGDVKKGDIGGYIEKEYNLSHDGNCWVFDNAWVSGNAKVYDNAWVSGNAKVSDDALVYDNAMVSGNAKVYDNARVSDDAKVYDNALVCGNAKVFDNARVLNNAKVCGDAKIYGNARVLNNAMVSGDAKVCGDAKIYGDAEVCGNAKVSGNAEVYDGANVNSNDDYALVQCFGSENRSTTFYLDKDRNIHVVCGCFKGTLDEFKSKVKETHGNTYLAEEYLDIANLMEKRFKNREEN